MLARVRCEEAWRYAKKTLGIPCSWNAERARQAKLVAAAGE
jgi:hypothetical protein